MQQDRNRDKENHRSNYLCKYSQQRYYFKLIFNYVNNCELQFLLELVVYNWLILFIIGRIDEPQCSNWWIQCAEIRRWGHIIPAIYANTLAIFDDPIYALLWVIIQLRINLGIIDRFQWKLLEIGYQLLIRVHCEWSLRRIQYDIRLIEYAECWLATSSHSIENYILIWIIYLLAQCITIFVWGIWTH